eukprot:m.31217 g.31217  ORF g.31217 m.31217 type:complete len:170 (+) comp16415_c0_seq1:307-816(+)
MKASRQPPLCLLLVVQITAMHVPTISNEAANDQPLPDIDLAEFHSVETIPAHTAYVFDDCEGKENCKCEQTGPCTECDVFEMAIDKDSDDPDWCFDTGYKQLIHCTYPDNSTQDTYQSCTIDTINRSKYFFFEGACFSLGLVSYILAGKRKLKLMQRIELNLQQRINTV